MTTTTRLSRCLRPWLAPLALASLFVSPLARGHEPVEPGARAFAPLTLAVIGDTPYGAAQLHDFPALVRSINDDPSAAVVVHVGDIKNGSTRCDDSYFAQIRGLVDGFARPFLYTPGDNEWTDCHRANNGKYDPLERLARIRQLFYPVPGETLGQQKRQVSSQSRVPGFETYVENQLWVQSRVVFSLVHLVGSNNNRLPWFGDDSADTLVDDPARRLAEVEARTAAALDWIDRTFTRAQHDSAQAVAIFMQADMWTTGAVDGFNAVAQRLADRAAAFARPVLLIQGDSHRFLVDRPFERGDARHGVTTAAPNVTRLVVEGETASEWLRLEVDPRTPQVFSWRRIFRSPRPVLATRETPPLFDDQEGGGGDADADDPAIWVHPTLPQASLVLGTKKNAGLSVYDLDGQELQPVKPPGAPGEGDSPGRFNNVDVLYGFPLRGRAVDLAVVTDRGRDQLRFYVIDPAAAGRGLPPLTDVTAANVPYVFSRDQDEVNQQTTAYGLATTSVGHGLVSFAFVSQRSRTRVASLVLIPRKDGRVSYQRYEVTTLPNDFALPGGGTWTACQDDDGQQSQVEGMVVDHQEQVLYLAQEQIGIWRLSLFRLGARPQLFEKVREYGVPYERVFDEQEEEYACTLHWNDDPGAGGNNLAADAEGLTIYNGGPGGTDPGYLITSSQGDSTFSIFERTGSNRLLGRFAVTDGPTDGTQHCDGAAVVSAPLGPKFPRGLLVLHDGENTPEVVDAEGKARGNTNFKYVAWPDLAATLFLQVTPWAGPR